MRGRVFAAEEEEAAEGLCFLWYHVRGIYNAEEEEATAEAAVHGSSNPTLPLGLCYE